MTLVIGFWILQTFRTHHKSAKDPKQRYISNSEIILKGLSDLSCGANYTKVKAIKDGQGKALSFEIEEAAKLDDTFASQARHHLVERDGSLCFDHVGNKGFVRVQHDPRGLPWRRGGRSPFPSSRRSQRIAV
ncbi:hypothetical protein [Acetobacter pasteurianus]|uniref:Uncharacterized protein n=1 Tax=Acetobacter pasteurianus NBRC 3188 TaxID=1226663 RepID=A0A401WXE2_ACEPA|nr:hypothetical protein [Acetobacter pasteurianus]GCD54008.1 hypothetical protein NBRC3188_2705 [Acetobacter pasteurianus NBRC 3188]